MRRVLTAPRAKTKTPVPFSNKNVGRATFGMRIGADKRSQMAVYDQNTTVHAIVSRLSSDTSQTNWHLFKKTRDQRRNYGPAEDSRVEILPDRHQASKIWAKPNAFYTQQEFIESFMQHLELTGLADWVVEFSAVGNIPLGMWVVDPSRIEVIPDPEEYIKGYVYTSPDGEKVPLEKNQVIQIRVPNPMNALDGSTPLTAAGPDILAGRNAALFNNKFYENGAYPAGIIEAPGSISDQDFDDLQAQWRENHQGVNNAHRVGILEMGMKFNPVSPSAKDQQYIEQRQFVSESVRESWGFPRFMLGMPEGTNRATAEAAEYVYAKYLLDTRLKRIKQALNNDFLPLFGDSGSWVEFDYDCVIPEDLNREARERVSKASAFNTYVKAGVDPEDAAIVCGLPELKMIALPKEDEPEDNVEEVASENPDGTEPEDSSTGEETGDEE